MKSEIWSGVNNLLESNSEMMNKVNLSYEVLKKLRKFEGETWVIKVDGFILSDDDLLRNFAYNVSLLYHFNIGIVIVHGGEKLAMQHIMPKNKDIDIDRDVLSLDQECIEKMEEFLCCKIRSKIIKMCNEFIDTAIGITGKDANLVKGKKMRAVNSKVDSNLQEIVDLGFVCNPTEINHDTLFAFMEARIMPIISPLCYGDNDLTYYSNASMFAGKLADEIAASRLILIGDNPGLIQKNNIIKSASVQDVEDIIENVSVDKFMAFDLNASICYLNGCYDGKVHIFSGKVPQALIMEFCNENGIGTVIEADSDSNT